MKQVCCATAVTLLDLEEFCDKTLKIGYSKSCPLSVKQHYKEILLGKVLKLTKFHFQYIGHACLCNADIIAQISMKSKRKIPDSTSRKSKLFNFISEYSVFRDVSLVLTQHSVQ